MKLLRMMFWAVVANRYIVLDLWRSVNHKLVHWYWLLHWKANMNQTSLWWHFSSLLLLVRSSYSSVCFLKLRSPCLACHIYRCYPLSSVFVIGLFSKGFLVPCHLPPIPVTWNALCGETPTRYLHIRAPSLPIHMLEIAWEQQKQWLSGFSIDPSFLNKDYEMLE
jgi:hypothetical protein